MFIRSHPPVFEGHQELKINVFVDDMKFQEHVSGLELQSVVGGADAQLGRQLSFTEGVAERGNASESFVVSGCSQNDSALECGVFQKWKGATS